jgi:chromosome segregation ATPase
MSETTWRRVTDRLVVGAGAVMLAAMPAAAQTISKCQDAQGQWHYGDHAAEECAKSVVTELDKQGRKVGEDRPPPTAEELAAEEAHQAKQQTQLEAERQQQELDRRLLAAYDSESAIVAARDRRMAAIDSEIRVSEAAVVQISAQLEDLAGELQNVSGERQVQITSRIGALERQLRRHTELVAEKVADKQRVGEQYRTLLERYHELTANQ